MGVEIKLLNKQVDIEIRKVLYKSYNILLSSKENKSELVTASINQAETMMDVYYPKYSSVQRTNVQMFIRLLRLYNQYEGSRDYDIAPKFSTWVDSASETAAMLGVDRVLVDNFYGNKNAAIFFFPILMDNQLLSASLSMQKRLHISMRRLDRIKYGYLIKRVSEDLSDTQVALN